MSNTKDMQWELAGNYGRLPEQPKAPVIVAILVLVVAMLIARGIFKILLRAYE